MTSGSGPSWTCGSPGSGSGTGTGVGVRTGMGGRDRTGMISMVLLSIAGIEPEAIVDDYLETWRGRLPVRPGS